MKTIKIKAFIDSLKDNFSEYLYEPIMTQIPYGNEDDVYEFEIIIKNIKDISDKVGVDSEGSRDYHGCEVTVVSEPDYITTL